MELKKGNRIIIRDIGTSDKEVIFDRFFGNSYRLFWAYSENKFHMLYDIDDILRVKPVDFTKIP